VNVKTALSKPPRSVSEWLGELPSNADAADTTDSGLSSDPNFVVVRSPRGLRQLTSELRDRQRSLPVIGLGTDASGRTPAVGPGALRGLLDPRIRIYFVASAGMRARLAQRLGVDLALTCAIRIWWPGLTFDSDPEHHPRVLARADEAATLQAFAVELDRSRPMVRSLQAQLDLTTGRLAETQRALHAAQRDAKDANKAARAAEVELQGSRKRLAAVEALGEQRLAQIAGMDSEEGMHFAIFCEWLRALTAADRRNHPLGEYVFGPRFLASVHDTHVVAPPGRVAFACAMLACGRAERLASLAPRPLPGSAQGAGRRHKNEREDDARGWICQLGGKAGAKRLIYWTHPGGRIELDSIQSHDEAGRR
jgi:hypothetical protein